MRQRRVMQADLARTLGWHTSNLSRVLSGKRTLSRAALRPVAAALECSPGDLLQLIGAPIPSRGVKAILPEPPKGFERTAFDRRLAAVLSLLGLDRLDELLEFLATGHYERMPDPVARRLRNILEADE